MCYNINATYIKVCIAITVDIILSRQALFFYRHVFFRNMQLFHDTLRKCAQVNNLCIKVWKSAQRIKLSAINLSAN